MNETYQEYVIRKSRELQDFYLFWSQGHELAPDAFPSVLGPGDWDEQFHFFTENRKEKTPCLE